MKTQESRRLASRHHSVPRPHNIKFDAQISTEVSPCTSERCAQVALLDVQKLRIQGDGIHRSHGLPKRKDYAAENRQQSICQRIPGHGGRKTRKKNSFISIEMYSQSIPRERDHSRERDDRISERGEGSESSGSESGGVPGGPVSEGPRPDVSVGPPVLHPPLLPYFYPPVPGLYPGHGPLIPPNPLGLHGGVTPGMLLNAQLALAASQHPGLFAHYPHPLSSPLHQLKGHRFAPYTLPAPSHGSAFETVTPGSRTLSPRSPPPRPPTGSPTPACVGGMTTANSGSTTTGELKSIENMVNGLHERRSIKRRRSPSLTPGHRNEADGDNDGDDDDEEDEDLDITSGDESTPDERKLEPDSTSEPS
ncbi:hypothetical protein PV327_004835 [Microctonus hyperodae]|uniref:Uncharacterized protein n=1 Tax=Microctonus hyperodae TaxID=165561 RepID=A0AA39FDF9_MICHY|nr:hypothetical protein PV327_004835 [Microctonus hyperodae]